MKQYYSIILYVAFTLSATSPSFAVQTTVNGITWTYTVSNGEVSLGAGSTSSKAVPTSTTGALTIPSTLGGYPVTSIGYEAFYGCSGLTSVTIPDSVTSIGSQAFYRCYMLTSVTLPDGMANIGDNAFDNCINLTSVTIPDSVTSIGRGAFSYCSASLFDTNMIAGVKLLDGWAVGYTYSLLGQLDLTGIRGIGSSAFYNCRGLTSVTIPSSVTSIGSEAFYGCSGLTSVTIPSSVTSIGDEAFYGCSGLTSVTIPNSVTNIGRDAFHGCSGLTRVTIPGSVTNIGRYAFSECSGLTSVAIPNGVTCIEDGAFAFCRELTSVTIPDSVMSIGCSAFLDCTNLTSVSMPNSVTNIGSYAFNGCSGLTSVTIPNSVTRIEDEAFAYCRGLTSVMIPDSVRYIGAGNSYGDKGAFYGCYNLTNITIPSRWTLSSVFKDSYTKITSVTIPFGSTDIVAGAFKGCSVLTSITIPDTVTSIGDEGFYNCSSLQQLTIPDSVASYGVNCFEGCPAYTLSLYRAIFGGGSGGGSPVVVTTVVQNVEAPYALTGTAADRAIASVTVNGDCSIDSFVLKDGKVYDSMLYVSNTADREVTLSLPSGYTYKTIKGARPLTIPASSQCMISITRVAANVFLVMREELDDVQ